MSSAFDGWLDVLERLREGLGPYEPIPIIEELFKFLYQGLVMIDTEGRIAFMDKPTEQWFGLPPGSGRGKNFSDFFPDLGLLDVAKTGIPQIGRIQEIRGTKRLVTRLPIIKNRQLIGAVGTMVFHDLDGIEKYLDNKARVPQAHAKVFSFKHTFPPKNSLYTFRDILGISQSITETKERAMRIALTDSTVLLIGETGTGKELFAHSIHGCSKRAGGPFVPVNCATIPVELAESELFGYEKGAFTGGNSSGQKGKFELASGGTIFLDEISAMPLALQPKLLRVIQEKEIQPLGSDESRKVDFRLIAATNMDLSKLVEKGGFRADLYYRVTSVPVLIRPLRERREDILFLAKSLLPNINRKLSGNVQSISAQALQLMQHHPWLGNVRELINVLEQSVLNAYPSMEIDISHMPAFLNSEIPDRLSDEKDIRGMLADAERKAINQALEKTKGNKKKAAKLLGISRAGLYHKFWRLGMR